MSRAPEEKPLTSPVIVRTDTATVAVFDPAVLGARRDAGGGWWCQDLSQVPEVRSGQVAIVALGADGIYAVRPTFVGLTVDETVYASDHFVLGLEVRSGRVFVGPGEYLPGGGVTVDSGDSALASSFIDVPIGFYCAHIYGVSWEDSPQWYSAGEVAPGAPADVVVALQPRSDNFDPPEREPRLFESPGRWVFPELPRRLGPEPGMLLTTTVVRRRDELVLKPCGPLDYRPVLPEMGGLKCADQVLVEVAHVNHDTREFVAVLQGLPKSQ
jgi:hypothetical protein